MDNSEALQLLEELDTIRAKAGLPRMDEVSRRDFLKRAGAGAATAAAGAAGMAIPKDAQAGLFRDLKEDFRILRHHTSLNIENLQKAVKAYDTDEYDWAMKTFDNAEEAFKSHIESHAVQLSQIINNYNNILGAINDLESHVDQLIDRSL